MRSVYMSDTESKSCHIPYGDLTVGDGHLVMVNWRWLLGNGCLGMGNSRWSFGDGRLDTCLSPRLLVPYYGDNSYRIITINHRKE
jgi:hypothetical protein